MSVIKQVTNCIVFLFLGNSSFALQTVVDELKELEKQSFRLVKAIENESLAETLSVFGNDATLLPEYHKSLWGKPKIGEYYRQFFDKAETVKFTKAAFEIIPLEEYFVELGTFEHLYKTPAGKNFEYIGKYMTYWKINDGETPKIFAHMWGSSSYFNAKNLNFISIDVTDSKAISPSNQWERDIEEMRNLAYKAVFAGDSKTQMESYAEDATYMTYYDPPFIGKEKITEYFDSHYNPDVPMDSLMTKSVKVIDMGRYALKFGEYYVEWTWEGQPSYIEGKGLALYKRMGDGAIKIYRQMINHSIPATPKE